MNKRLFVIFSIATLLFTSGCGGRKANLVEVEKIDDYGLSCRDIERETDLIKNEIRQLTPDSDKSSKNFALGMAGMFSVVPWFFMDFTHTEQKEIDAYRKRHNHLVVISTNKDCGNKIAMIPDYFKEVILDERFRERLSGRRAAKEKRIQEIRDMKENRVRLKKLRKIRAKLEKAELNKITTLEQVNDKIRETEERIDQLKYK